MEKRVANNVSLGIFVFIGFLGFIFLLFKVGDGSQLFSSQITLYARYEHVKGLHAGSEVSLAGLRIGVVKSIDISDGPEKELIVEFVVDRKYQKQIRTDSTARIVTQGVLGDKYIQISIGSPEQEMLKDGQEIAAASDSDIWSKGKVLMEKIGGKFEKEGDMTKFMENLNKLSANLVTLTNDIKNNNGLLWALIYGKGGKKMDKAVNHLESIFGKINNGKGTLGALVNDPTVYEDIKHLFGGARRSTVLKYFMRQFIEEGGKEKK